MIYLDNAATSYPKPSCVVRAVTDANLRCGNSGRGGHRLAMNGADVIYSCRKSAAELFNTVPERVIITAGATHSLNMAINPLKDSEGAILISNIEHNAVVRPAVATKKEVRVFDACLNLMGNERVEAILKSIDSISDGASAVIMTGASNICGADMPVKEVGEYCKKRGILFIVDAAQAGGVYDIDMVRDNIDILCLPGHKGLYGPMGCGLMLLAEGVLPPPFMLGGSGVNSMSTNMPSLPPERYEAGTLPVCLIAGLNSGIEYVRQIGIENIRSHEEFLAEYLKAELISMKVKVFAPEHKGGIVLFNIYGMSSEDVAGALDAFGICTRAGLHCASLAHKALDSDGAVRISFGATNTIGEVKALLNALKAICK